MKGFLFSTLCIATLSISTGCISTSPQTSQANDDNKLTIYSALEEEQISYYMEGFREDSPEVEVEIIMDSHGVIASKLLAEKDNPQADVIWGLSAMNMIQLEEEGALKEYMPKNYNKVGNNFKDLDGNVSWVGMSVPETAIVVNYKELEKLNLPIPIGYEDLIKPEYKGLITMPNPASSGTGYLTVSGLIQMMGEDKAYEYMDSLHKNIANYTHSGSKPAKLAGSGEYPIGITLGYRAVKQMETGEPVQVVFPKEGSGWDLEANALVNKENIKEEAKVFLDWATSDQAMDRYSKDVAVTSIKTQNPVPKGYSKDPFNQLIKEVDLSEASKNRSEVLKTWESKYGSKSESK
ncbi:MAG: putative 2-aminoethylphosphonate ABC transporter substrate-binding protein [Romboutsia sp.]|uniref:putative 2-aminoethylphosphonate ABC transporter substrate-binding protein n=1 Tax=Romboutsia sp. TaxID=1965302 RepID=UPI003F345C61